MSLEISHRVKCFCSVGIDFGTASVAALYVCMCVCVCVYSIIFKMTGCFLLFFFLSSDRSHQVDYFAAMVHASHVCVAIVHQTLTWTSGSLTCAQMLMVRAALQIPKEEEEAAGHNGVGLLISKSKNGTFKMHDDGGVCCADESDSDLICTSAGMGETFQAIAGL